MRVERDDAKEIKYLSEKGFSEPVVIKNMEKGHFEKAGV